MLRQRLLLGLISAALLGWLPAARPAQAQPITLQPVGFAATNERLRQIDVRGEYAYVLSDSLPRLDIYSIADPAAPQLIGSYSERSAIIDMLIVGDYLYLGTSRQILQVLSLADPARPQPVLPASLDGEGVNLAYAQGHLFVALGLTGVRVYSLADPAHPQAVGAIDWRRAEPSLTWVAYDVIAWRDTLYVSVENGHSAISRRLFVVDAGDPAAPVHVNQTEWRIDTARLAGARDGYGYQMDYPGAFAVLDLRDPAAITRTGVLSGTSTSEAGVVDWAGRYAYLAGNAGVRAIDISDPAAPALAGSALAGSATDDLVVRGRYVYVAASNGLHILTNGLALDQRQYLPAVGAPGSGG